MTERSSNSLRAGFELRVVNKQLKPTAGFAPADLQFLEQSVHRLGLSIRSFHRLQRVARTIADLEGEPKVDRKHLMLAQAIAPWINY